MELSANVDMLRRYRDYTYARAETYYNKEILKLARNEWTDHPQIQDYKFTNVNRRLDRESKWLLDNVIHNPNMSEINKVLHCALFRCVNSGTAMEALYSGIDFDDVHEGWLDNRFDDYELNIKDTYGGPVQSSAYFLSHIKKQANDHAAKKWWEYTPIALIAFINKFADQILLAYYSETGEQACEKLQVLPSFGDFMSYQIWVDWSYMSENGYDDDDFTISGPGCDSGVDWMVYGKDLIVDGKPDFGKFAREGGNYTNYLTWFRDNLPQLMSNAGVEWEPKHFLHFMPEDLQRWGLMEVENSFCEFNKLNKLVNKISMRVRRF